MIVGLHMWFETEPEPSKEEAFFQPQRGDRKMNRRSLRFSWKSRRLCVAAPADFVEPNP